MLLYLALGIGIVIILHLSLSAFSRADSTRLRRWGKWLIAAGVVAILLVLIRFGQGPIASLVGGIAVALPLITRLMQVYVVWRNVRGSFQAARQSGDPMTHDEARKILGVGADAGEEEIQAAYKRLMQRIHPDHGGSEYLASKLNQARDLLLKH
ncbi:MAG: DnaJ domain-containing protein [Alphaproteobacteria bacterium]|nr:DnaJ domain-containing protein [Alphaproteobacteria bacterium]